MPNEQEFPNLEAAKAATAAEREAALKYLLEKWPEGRQTCPICSSQDWGISDVAELPVRAGASEAIPQLHQQKRVFPLLPVNCRVCGYTFFINEKWVRGDMPKEGES